MKSIIGILKKDNFIESNYDEVLQGNFTEFTQGSDTQYMRINTFEKYAMQNSFEHIFYTEAEFEAWLVEVPVEISKLQAISLLLQQGKYNDMITAIEADPTGVKKVLFDAASVLYRDSNLVAEVAQDLLMSSEDMDTFFIDASKILI